jgi:ribonuclease P protein component
MKLIRVANELSYNRVAFAPRKKYGTAVARNRAKRLARECYRSMKPELRKGYDFVFVLFPGHDSVEIRRGQMRRLLGEARMFRSLP